MRWRICERWSYLIVMANYLEQLKGMTVVVADTGDFESMNLIASSTFFRS